MTTLSTAERTAAIKAAIVRAESALADIAALATDDYRALIPADVLAKAETSHAKATKAVGSMHRAFAKAAKGSGDVVVQSGGGGK